MGQHFFCGGAQDLSGWIAAYSDRFAFATDYKIEMLDSLLSAYIYIIFLVNY